MDFDPVELIGGALGRSVYELLRQRLVKEILVPSPAAGAEWSTVVPAGVMWELLTVHYRLTTSAVVANRFPLVLAQDTDGNEIERMGPSNSVAASQVQAHTGLCGYGTIISGGTTLFPLPDPEALLLPGWTLKTGTSSIDVGDQYTQVVLTVREWSAQAVQSNLDWLMETLRR